MSFWKELFDGSGGNEANNPLVAKLISPSDYTFETGLSEVVSIVKRGDEAGLRAIKEAIILLSGLSDFTSYKPGMVAASGTEYAEAENDLLELAARKQFLRDPHKTQKLIAAFKFLGSSQDFDNLRDDVYSIGGSSEAHALLLLNMEMWAYVQLSRRGGM